MTANYHRRHKIDRLKGEARRVFVFGASLALCGLLVYAFVAAVFQ